MTKAASARRIHQNRDTARAMLEKLKEMESGIAMDIGAERGALARGRADRVQRKWNLRATVPDEHGVTAQLL